MHNLADEYLRPLKQLRPHLPPSARTGRPVHPSVIFRWIRRGLKAGDGTVVHLAGTRCGGCWCSSPAAVQRFFSELTARAGVAPSAPVTSASSLADTAKRLAAAGLK